MIRNFVVMFAALVLLFVSHKAEAIDSSAIVTHPGNIHEPLVVLKPAYSEFWTHPDFPGHFLVVGYHIPCDISFPITSGTCAGVSYTPTTLYNVRPVGQMQYCGMLSKSGDAEMILVFCDRTWPYTTPADPTPPTTPGKTDEYGVIHVSPIILECEINIHGTTQSYAVCVQDDGYTVLYRVEGRGEVWEAIFSFAQSEIDNLPSTDVGQNIIYNLGNGNCQINLLPLQGMAVNDNGVIAIPIECNRLVN